MKVKYVGPIDEVEVTATGAVVKRGGTVEVPDDIGESLLEQADWEKPGAKTTGGDA